MKGGILLGIIYFFFAFAIVYSAMVEEHKKYKIGDEQGVLTVEEGNKTGSNVSILAWNGTDSQQWSFEKASGENMYVIHLNSTEGLNLVLDVEQNEFGFFTRLFTFGSQRHWELKDSGDGHWEIKNHRFGLCLKSFGLGQATDIAECNNATETHWNITQL